MTPPETESRPGARAALESDHQGRGIDSNGTPFDLADEVADAAELVVTGGLLSSRDIECAQRLLDLAPPEAYRHPMASFVVRVATGLAAEHVVPSPLSVITYALRRAIPVPERQTPVAALARIAADSTMCGDPGWAARQVGLNHYRRLIAAAGLRISAGAWSDSAELAELVEREIAAINAAVEAVAG